MHTACMQLLDEECDLLFDGYYVRITNDVILLLNKPFSVAAGCENTGGSALLPRFLKDYWDKGYAWAAGREVEYVVICIEAIFDTFGTETACGDL